MNLVIVESPTKAKTIQKFLEKQFTVLSSYGHVRDLPKSKLGIDLEKGFLPQDVIPSRARKNVGILKKEVKKAETVLLSCDPDREGEAIAWHLSEVLELDGKKPYQRIVFHEITKEAVNEALKNPRKIDMNLVDAQQARRILDRIVGYQLSPFLWKKVARKLSAGRVQSVAVRLVAEKEREIEKFVPQEYWQISAELKKTDGVPFEAFLAKKSGETMPRLAIKNEKEAGEMTKSLQEAGYTVSEVEKRPVKRNPPPPYTTSTLQQDAGRRLRWTAKFTMQMAQQLYENGLITYHRTDSLNLSQSSLYSAEKFITENYGKDYWPGFHKRYKAKGRVQEAHEAIRPAYAEKTPEKIGKSIDEKQLRLYELIWKRFIACQMSEALFESSSADISAGEFLFRANGQTMKFDGYLKVYPQKFEEKNLPPLEKGDLLELLKLSKTQHFTEPPARYSEASLIAALEENGIGRPSTYAPILSNIQEKNYIEKNDHRRLAPTEMGKVVNDLLVRHFPEIVDISFTAKMEEELDEVAEGRKKWPEVIEEFYGPFENNLKKKYQEVSKTDLIEETDKVCPKCRGKVIIRLGKYGKFYACSSFPKCRYTESLKDNSLNVSCPNCSSPLTEKRTKRGKIFYGCSSFPKCNFALWDKPLNQKCPKCLSLMVETKRKQVKCSNKECGFRVEK